MCPAPWRVSPWRAIKYAREGIPVENDLFDSLHLSAARLNRWPASARIFTRNDGMPYSYSDRLIQNDLAMALEEIARGGPQAFYTGALADSIANAVRAAGGVMSAADLSGYRAIERAPLRGTYRGYDILSMPPPSSGGTLLVQMLNILEGFPLGDAAAGYGYGSPQALHVMIEAMKLAYADRAEFLGDSDAVAVPLARLISKEHGNELRAEIDTAKARSSRELRPNSPATINGSGGNTTHYSVMDQQGNAVANTYSLNFNYGLGLVADGTGILLNLRPRWQRRQCARRQQTSAVINDANHRAQGRQAADRHRRARRQPHHHSGAASDRQRDRLQAIDCRCGRRAAPASSMAARSGTG